MGVFAAVLGFFLAGFGELVIGAAGFFGEDGAVRLAAEGGSGLAVRPGRVVEFGLFAGDADDCGVLGCEPFQSEDGFGPGQELRRPGFHVSFLFGLCSVKVAG